MEFTDISENSKPHPGEFLLHVPTNSIVICGAYMGEDIRVLNNGRLFVDSVGNFKKLLLSKEERKNKSTPKCKACG